MNKHNTEALGREAKERYAAYVDIQCQGGSTDEARAALSLWNQAQKNLFDALYGKPAGPTAQQKWEKSTQELIHRVRHG